ncbi:hypothetical protein ASG11_08335 [Sphingomonas sp. Leaf357]|uniref:hypothetical protein n=1 Tax=Sphingomonas sp. Leaf357 TaxID=1736350 RepID=UPI0006F8FB44|nr:hypothetical protein [Sphingomonas sp. Leaf357]KQS04257.1 hypothetical protein ASG11_08335 [Sphingomonas sp. Leaf357]
MPFLPLLLLAQAAAAPMAPDMKMEKPEPVCVRAGDLPPAFAKWNAPASTGLTIGAPYLATGTEPSKLTGAVGDVVKRGGTATALSFTVAKAGVYQVGLASGAWVDVVSGGTALASAGHGHGPNCTGLRKIVDFKLASGRYTLQLSGIKTPTIKVMIVPK